MQHNPYEVPSWPILHATVEKHSSNLPDNLRRGLRTETDYQVALEWLLENRPEVELGANWCLVHPGNVNAVYSRTFIPELWLYDRLVDHNGVVDVGPGAFLRTPYGAQLFMHDLDEYTVGRTPLKEVYRIEDRRGYALLTPGNDPQYWLLEVAPATDADLVQQESLKRSPRGPMKQNPYDVNLPDDILVMLDQLEQDQGVRFELEKLGEDTPSALLGLLEQIERPPTTRKKFAGVSTRRAGKAVDKLRERILKSIPRIYLMEYRAGSDVWSCVDVKATEKGWKSYLDEDNVITELNYTGRYYHDINLLDQVNNEAIEEALGNRDWSVEHGKVIVQLLTGPPEDRESEPTESARIVADLVQALANYPSLNDDRLSELQWEAEAEAFEEAARDWRPSGQRDDEDREVWMNTLYDWLREAPWEKLYPHGTPIYRALQRFQEPDQGEGPWIPPIAVGVAAYHTFQLDEDDIERLEAAVKREGGRLADRGKPPRKKKKKR